MLHYQPGTELDIDLSDLGGARHTAALVEGQSRRGIRVRLNDGTIRYVAWWRCVRTD